MQLSADDLSYLSQCAIRAATEAGALIASRSTESVAVEHKAGGDTLASQVVTEVDLLSDAAIIKMLKPTCDRYQLAMLTEESIDDSARLKQDHFWCVDPLDGTLSFIESLPGYAVSIALVSRAGEPLIGVVYDPVTATLYSAVKGQGVERNGEPWCHVPSGDTPLLTLISDRTLESRSDFPQLLQRIETMATQLGFSGVTTLHNGGAVMSACWGLEHGPGCYFKLPKTEPGGGSLWDFAATAALFNEMGAVASDFYGQPLELNRAESTFMNHRGVIFATEQRVATELMSQLQPFFSNYTPEIS
ncbi:hypothetical protein BOW53_16175 [Solemya pervernicosa gill symbiont]|uniref:Inositol monophosphatase n=1 Tax=Solemya pervernicosa gill symbiont TaxID=642797 RepID=A0A1T2KZG3_9GAMM|nr:inositol monophosphatase family protein [Solemya pervernicosa gill symbiont]OOZ38235.1 hypothetical protein BOW53_16175 [Solemya pervernicosa gill symbiont]